MSINNRLKAIVIIWAGLSMGIIALLSGVSWYVNSTHCRSLLLQELNTIIPGRVTVAHHHLSLYTGTLSLREVTVKDQKDDDLVRIAGLSIDLSPTALFRKALVVDTVNIEQPRVFLRMDGNGRLNIVEAFTMERAQGETTAPSRAQPWFNIIVRRFKLSEGYLHFSEAQGNRNLTLEDVGISANGNLKDGSGVLKVGVGKSSLAYGGDTIDLNHFDLALAMKNGHIEPLVIKAENDFAALLLCGDIYQAFSDPELDLTLDMDVALGEAEAFFDLDRDDTGRVKALLKVKGKPDNPQVNLRVDYGGGRIAGRPIDRAGLQLQLTDRLATLDNLSADTGFGALGLSGQVDLRRVFPRGFLSPPAGWELTSFNGRLRAAALDLAAIPWDGENISGRMDALLNFSGSGLSPETLAADASVTTAIEDFRSRGMAQPAGVRSRVTGRMQAGTLWLDSMEVAAADAHISAGGSLDLGTEQVDVRFSLETREVASLLSIFGISQVKGAVAVNGHVKGRSTNPVINVSATGRDVRIRDIDFGNVALEAGLTAAGRLEVDTLTIANKGSSLNADVDLQLFAAPFELHPEMPLSARLVFSNVEYNDFFTNVFPVPDINGSLGGEVVLSGTVRSLEASVVVLAEGIEVEQIRLGDLAGKARFLDGKLLLDSLRLTNNRTDLEAMGEISLLRKDTWQTVENPVFKLDLADGHVFLEDFTNDLSGELIIDADLAGQLKAPRGGLALKGQNIDLGFQQIEMFGVNMQAGDKAVTIEPFDIKMPRGGAIKGEGRVGFDRSFQFQLQSRGLPIDSIDRVRELKQIGGQLDLDIQGSGFIHRPEISGKMKWSGIRVKNEAIDDLIVQFGLKDNRISLDGKQTFDLSAAYDLSSKAFSMDLTMNNTSLTPWFVITGRPELSGRVSGLIEAEGMAGSLKGTRATVNIQELGIDFKGEPIAAAHALRGTLDQNIFNIPGFQVELLGQGHLSVKGSGEILGPVNLEVEGDIPLKAANLFVRNLPEINGVLSLKTSLAGTFKEPQLKGEFRIEKGGVFIPELQQELHSLNGRVAFSSAGEIVGGLSGMFDSGRFDVQTAIDLEGFLPSQIEARITAANLPLKIPDTMEMFFNTDLTVRGTPDQLVVAGDIVLLEGTYYKNFKFNLLQALQEEKREERPQEAKFAYPYLKPLQFNIYFKHRQPFLVDNNIAYMEISPDVNLRGTPENPIITGAAKVDNGAITYQNKEFVIRRGSIDFINPYRTEAEIDIKGDVAIREWLITISLYGPPDHLTVELSSSPPEEDADIISLLVFKKTLYEMNAGSGGAGQSPTVLLAQLLASSFGDDIKNRTGIDILEVEAESARDTDSADRIKVTVGKDLSERMSIRYSVETKDGGYVQRASTEYKLFEHFSLSGFQDTKGVYGGELIFRLAFRLFR